jgi:hypothetical protein
LIAATSTDAGLMTAADKSKLDELSAENNLDINGTGTRTISTTPTLAPLGIEAINTGTAFSSSGGVITYTGVTKRVEITYSTSCDAGSNARSVSRHALYINGVLVNRSTRYAYHRTIADGEDTATYSGIYEINNADTVELRSAENSAGDSVIQLLGQTNLTIKII